MIVLAVLALLASFQDPISEPDARDLLAKLIPAAGEKWLTIPWKTDLLEARDTAAKERKPVFLWSMNGHPLGCT